MLIPLRFARTGLITFLVFIIPSPGSAFQISEAHWATGEATFLTKLSGGSVWQIAFESAQQAWNLGADDFVYSSVNAFVSPCLDDGLNGVDFTTTVCGSDYGSAIAVTMSSFFISDGSFVETDIVFDSNEPWSIYGGPLQAGQTDFSRVAVHELGHALGLDHESVAVSIMNPFVGNIETPQQDDFDGVAGIYDNDSLAGCEPVIQTINFTVNGKLESGDCTFGQLSAASSDPSFVDLYQISAEFAGTLTVTMTSAVLDSYLILSDLGLTSTLIFDDDSAGGLDAQFSVVVEPGGYIILANYFEATEITGNYLLASTFVISDVDGDGLPDSWESEYFGGLGQGVAADFDKDGLSNIDEFSLGTNPAKRDTDRDGLPDGYEVDNGLNPLKSSSSADADGDGFSNLAEFRHGTDPNDPSSSPPLGTKNSAAINLLLLSP